MNAKQISSSFQLTISDKMQAFHTSSVNWFLMKPCVSILGEALRLAKDFNYLCENEFPMTGCADVLVKSTSYSTPGSILARRSQICAARQAAHLLSAWKTYPLIWKLTRTTLYQYQDCVNESKLTYFHQFTTRSNKTWGLQYFRYPLPLAQY